MKTTNLFVELVVVGTGAALFVVLLLFTFYGDQPWFSQLSKSDDVASIIPVLSVIYLLGIIVDKIAYRVFKSKEDGLRRAKFKDSLKPEAVKPNAYYDARHRLFTSPNTTAAVEAFEFGRSKIRICRGWTVNSILIILALICFIFWRGPDSRVVVGLIACCLLAWGACWSWGVATAVELDSLERFHQMQQETSKTDVQIPSTEKAQESTGSNA